MITVIKERYPKKQTTCLNCEAVLEYLKTDIKSNYFGNTL